MLNREGIQIVLTDMLLSGMATESRNTLPVSPGGGKRRVYGKFTPNVPRLAGQRIRGPNA
jgi:hypothetical protein